VREAGEGAAWQAHVAGQGLVEYALILAFVAVVSVVVLAAFGTSVASLFSQANVAF